MGTPKPPVASTEQQARREQVGSNRVHLPSAAATVGGMCAGLQAPPWPGHGRRGAACWHPGCPGQIFTRGSTQREPASLHSCARERLRRRCTKRCAHATALCVKGQVQLHVSRQLKMSPNSQSQRLCKRRREGMLPPTLWSCCHSSLCRRVKGSKRVCT